MLRHAGVSTSAGCGCGVADVRRKGGEKKGLWLWRLGAHELAHLGEAACISPLLFSAREPVVNASGAGGAQGAGRKSASSTVVVYFTGQSQACPMTCLGEGGRIAS